MNVLPLAVAGTLTHDEAVNEYLRKIHPPLAGKPVDASSSRVERYAQAARVGITNEFLRIPAGQGKRHHGLVTMCLVLASLEKGGWPVGNIRAAIFDAGRAAERTDDEMRDAYEWAQDIAQPRPLTLAEKPRRAYQRRPTFHIKLNTPDLATSDLPRAGLRGVYCVDADKGAGKTEWGRVVCDTARATGQLTRIMAVTPSIALTQAVSERYQLENYLALTSIQRQQAIGIAITLNSLEGFAQPGGARFPRYDILILDELMAILRALGSKKLFKGGKATRVYSVLKRLIQEAGCVLVLDADLSDIEIDWLQSIRSDMTHVHNEYRRPYGPMTVIEEHDALLTLIEASIRDNRGLVFVACSSRGEVKRLYAVYSAIYGEDKILAIHADNSTNPRQKAFLADPDGQISQYRAVFVSPSVMRGLNIQATVYKTFGLFHARPIDARDALQMLARARNTGHSYVWVEQRGGKRPHRWKTIYNRARRAAQGTEILCALNKDGFLDFDSIQKEFLTLQAKIQARANHSLNNLRGHFIHLARRNYTVTINQQPMPTHGAAAVNQAGEQLNEAFQAMILTVPPVSPEEHRRKCVAGTRTDADNAGLIRWEIEDFYKQPITEPLLKFDASGKGRERLQLYIDVIHTPETRLRELDRLEAYDRTPIQSRSNLAMRQRTARAMLLAVWGGREAFIPETILGENEIETRMTTFLDQHHDQVYLYLKGRKDHSQKPLRILQRTLRMAGLRLEEVRSRDRDTPKRWRLACDALERMEGLAKVRLASLEAEERESMPKEWERYKNP